MTDAARLSGFRFKKLALAIWGAGIVSGFAVLWKYSSTAGLPATPPTVWPRESRLTLPRGSEALLFFIHPNCPCSRASLAELGKAFARAKRPVTAYVLCVPPEETDGSCEASAVPTAASAIPGVLFLTDQGGTEAKRFGARTSGQVLFYGREGSLCFQGGITGTRGHEGDNPGQQSLVALLTGGVPERTQTPVYGCPLFNLP